MQDWEEAVAAKVAEVVPEAVEVVGAPLAVVDLLRTAVILQEVEIVFQ